MPEDLTATFADGDILRSSPADFLFFSALAALLCLLFIYIFVKDADVPTKIFSVVMSAGTGLYAGLSGYWGVSDWREAPIEVAYGDRGVYCRGWNNVIPWSQIADMRIVTNRIQGLRRSRQRSHIEFDLKLQPDLGVILPTGAVQPGIVRCDVNAVEASENEVFETLRALHMAQGKKLD